MRGAMDDSRIVREGFGVIWECFGPSRSPWGQEIRKKWLYNELWQAWSGGGASCAKHGASCAGWSISGASCAVWVLYCAGSMLITLNLGSSTYKAPRLPKGLRI